MTLRITNKTITLSIITRMIKESNCKDNTHIKSNNKTVSIIMAMTVSAPIMITTTIKTNLGNKTTMLVEAIKKTCNNTNK